MLLPVDGAPYLFYDRRVRVADWLFAVIVVGFVAVLCLGAVVGGLDLSDRRSRTEALLRSSVMGGVFFWFTGAWIGLCIPVAVIVLMTGGISSRSASEP